MKSIITSVFITILSIVSNAQSLNFQWAKQFGGISGSPSGDIFMGLDGQGNVYTAGMFNGTVDFNPSLALSDTFNMTSAVGGDIFFTKLDSMGAFSWAEQITCDSLFDIKSFVVTDSGNLFYVGSFGGTIDFDPGPGVYNITPSEFGPYISKLNSSGNLIWASSLITFGSHNTGEDVVVDKVGNSYVSGTWVILFSGQHGRYLTQFDTTGAQTWIHPNGDGGRLATDSSGCIYTYAIYYFFRKITSVGSVLWSTDPGLSQMSGMASDYTGNIFMTGYFSGSRDFDPDTSHLILTSIGSYDIFVCKYNSAGIFKWVRQFGSTGGWGYSNAIATDTSGNVYITGFFTDTVDFDPGVGVHNMVSSNGHLFITKLNSSGNFVWAVQFGGASNSSVTGIKVSASGEIVLTGKFSGTADFDPGPNVANLTSIGSEDIFVLKLNQLPCSVDTSVSYNGGILTANAAIASYQWIDCSNHSPVVGQTNQNFVPTTIGSYAVVVTQNTCSETSSCYSILNVGMNENYSFGGVHVFPNPVHGILSMTFDRVIQNGCIKIIDITGQTVFEKSNLFGTGFTFDLSGYSNGFYMIELKDGENVSRMKLVKN